MNSLCLFNEMISLSSLKVEGSWTEDRNIEVNLKISQTWLENNKKVLRIDLSDPEYVEFLYFETFTEEKNFTISSNGKMLNVDFDSFTRHIVQFMNLTLQRSPTDSTELKCVLINENDICLLEFFFLCDEFESFTINLRAECIHGLCDHAIKRVKTLQNENERQAKTIAFLEDEIETIERKTGKYNREMEGKLRDADRKIQEQADRIVYLEDSLNATIVENIGDERRLFEEEKKTEFERYKEKMEEKLRVADHNVRELKYRIDYLEKNLDEVIAENYEKTCALQTSERKSVPLQEREMLIENLEEVFDILKDVQNENLEEEHKMVHSRPKRGGDQLQRSRHAKLIAVQLQRAEAIMGDILDAMESEIVEDVPILEQETLDEATFSNHFAHGEQNRRSHRSYSPITRTSTPVWERSRHEFRPPLSETNRLRGNNRVVERNVRFASPAPCEEEFTWGQKISDFDSQYIAANKSSPLLNHLWGVCNED